MSPGGLFSAGTGLCCFTVGLADVGGGLNAVLAVADNVRDTVADVPGAEDVEALESLEVPLLQAAASRRAAAGVTALVTAFMATTVGIAE
jgi:hypothetical protein